MLPETGNEPTPLMTKEQCDAQAERIAAVLRERKKIGVERRMPGREYQHRTYDRALARSYKERVEASQQPERRKERREASKQPERRIENMDVAYVVIMSCNAAIES
jgi:hypothetical protein